MSRLYAFVTICIVLLSGKDALAASTGVPSVGWLTIAGYEQSANINGATVYDTGYIQASAGSTTVAYSYSQSDAPQSIAYNLAVLLNSNSSSVTASAGNNIVIITSKATGSAANFPLSAVYGTYDPTDFAPSFQANTIGMIGGRDGPRNFPMIMYNDGPAATYADLPFVSAPIGLAAVPTPMPTPTATPTPVPVPIVEPQSPGHSILGLPGPAAWFSPSFNSVWDTAVGTINQYDLTRVDAVNIDEPYTALLSSMNIGAAGDPCAANDPRLPIIQQAYAALQAVANHIKQQSPGTRIWINFEATELDWMMNGSCASFYLPNGNQPVSLNAPYIDVVSLDDYLLTFGQIVQSDYNWLSTHPGHTGQQLALVPGAFVHSSGPGSDPVLQARILEQYFDYATTMNQSCSIPSSDPGANSCPVWMVAGFLYEDCSVCPDYIGLADAATAPIQAAWLAELSKPTLPPWLVPVNYLFDGN